MNVPTSTAPENRLLERSPTELRAVIQVKESENEMWKEVTRVTTVSRNGAGFSLPRPCKVGRLVTLVLPLDPKLRAYDEDKGLYAVMGLIQYCNPGMIDGESVFHVGVGFVGKDIPESYKADPNQNFRISGMRKDGLWEITEAESQFKNRKQPRYWISLPVTISLLQRAEQPVDREETYTLNIGSGGVSVACSLAAGKGDKVKFACKDMDFYAIAIVRNRKAPAGDVPTLNLEFVDAELPVDRLIESRIIQ